MTAAKNDLGISYFIWAAPDKTSHKHSSISWIFFIEQEDYSSSDIWLPHEICPSILFIEGLSVLPIWITPISIVFFLLGWVMTMPAKLYFDCQCQHCLIDYLTPSAARTKVVKCAEDFRCLWQYICSDTCWWKFLMCSRLCWGKLPPAAVLLALKICTNSFWAEWCAFKDREISSDFCSVLNRKLWKYTHTKIRLKIYLVKIPWEG